MGVQQCVNKGGEWVENSVYNIPWGIQTYSNVLWSDKFADYFSGDNEQHIIGPN